MSRADDFISAARQYADGADVREVVGGMASGAAGGQGQGQSQRPAQQQGGRMQQGQPGQQGSAQAGRGGVREEEDAFALDAGDFPAARDQSRAAGTRIQSASVSLNDAAEHLSRSYYERGDQGPVHVITPMVMPKGRRLRMVLPIIAMVLFGLVGAVILLPIDGLSVAVFGPHYWLLV